jgi:hypothetical protein
VSGTALALVLTAALLHATWNLAIKGAGGEDRVAFVWLYIVVCSAIWVPIGVVWVVVTGESPTWWWLGGPLVSAVLHVVYQLALQRGYAEGDLNLVYPLAGAPGPCSPSCSRSPSSISTQDPRRWRASSRWSAACC